MATQHVKGWGVQVTGLPELARALKRVDVEFLKEFKKELKGIAGDVISKAQGMGAPAGYLKTSVTQKGAGVSYPAGGAGSANDPLGHYPWLDWGGAPVVGRGVTASNRIDHQAAWRTEGWGGFRRESFYPKGRWLYPAIGSLSDEIGDKAGDAIQKAASREGFRVGR